MRYNATFVECSWRFFASFFSTICVRQGFRVFSALIFYVYGINQKHERIMRMSSSSFFRSAGTLVVVIALIVIVQHLLTQRSDSFSPSPSPPMYGTFKSQAITNLPSAAQNALNFIPQGNGNTFTVATLVESAAQLTAWEGSNDFPGWSHGNQLAIARTHGTRCQTPMG